MNSNKDVLVVKTSFNSDEEVLDLIEHFKEQFGDDAEILCLQVEDSKDSEVYWAGRRDRVTIKFEKVRKNAVIPTYKKEGDVSMNLSCIGLEYNTETDQYIYRTGLRIKNKPEGVYAYIKPSNSLNDCYLSDYMGFGESDYKGEILLMFKNRTSFEVRKMLNEWNTMKEITTGFELNKSAPTGETIEDMKSRKPGGVKDLDPLDYKPYSIGEEIAEIVFVNSPYAKTIEVKDKKLKKTENKSQNL